MNKLIITATIPLSDNPLESAKAQTSALEVGAEFEKKIKAVDKKATYEAKVSRVRADDAPKTPRKKKDVDPPAPPAGSE